MTARANSLTAHVTKPAADAGLEWSMPVNGVRAFLDALARLGYDVQSLLAAAALRDGDLHDPDARIPCEALGAMLSRAQQIRFTPNIGLEVARVTPLGAYPLLDYLVLTSDTVAAGAGQLARHTRLVGNPVAIDLHENVDPIRVELSAGAAPFSIEFVASLMVLHFRAETDGRFAAASVTFRHQPDDVESFARLLGCPVQPAASWNGLTISADAWRLPLRRRDPVLRQMLEARAEDVLARLPERHGVALDVQRVLAREVGGRETGIEPLARRLAMSGRTLQRRLAAEGVSYQELLDEARKEAAGRHLSESALAIGEVAYLVGYSEPAPFHRAFRRWYGMTPEAFRQARRQARPDV